MKLADYLKMNYLSPLAFSKKSGVPAQTVYNILKERGGQPRIATVGKILEATEGLVDISQK